MTAAAISEWKCGAEGDYGLGSGRGQDIAFRLSSARAPIPQNLSWTAVG